MKGHHVLIWEYTKFRNLKKKGRLDIFLKYVSDIEKVLKGEVADAHKSLEEIIKIKKATKNVKDKMKSQNPEILVIDSLNTVESEKKGELFDRFSDFSKIGPEIIIFILDSSSSTEPAEFWEYFCDIVVRLDRKYDKESDYMIRTIEIVKARYQQHVLGRHQFKVYRNFPKDNNNPIGVDKKLRKRSHPHRKEGGIFIFPSLHYYVSKYKRLSPTDQPNLLPIPVRNIEAISGKLPEGRCTALIGTRGAHKSHIGYLFMLSRIFEDEKALVVSLRDDEGIAEKTISKILRQEFKDKFTIKEKANEDELEKAAMAKLNDFKEKDLLEILYYPPGNITPEEFFHRMFMSIHRLKNDKNHKLTVLFNSLDQLPTRFPLCAKEKIFISAMIDILMALNITSIFVVVEEEGCPPKEYGLRAMADLMIKLTHKTYKLTDYCEKIKEYNQCPGKNSCEDCKDKNKDHLTTLIQINSFSGGQAAGAGGILELVDKSDKVLYKIFREEGLQCVPTIIN